MIDVLGAPLDLCGKRKGTRLGPGALRLAGLLDAVRAAGHGVRDSGDLVSGPEATEPSGLRNFEPALAFMTELKDRVGESMAQGHVPLVIGGDHALAAGSVAAALQQHGEGLAVLWIDAHADLNTPGSSPSGNMHGMPLSLLAGEPSGSDGFKDAQWGRWREAMVTRDTLSPTRLAWLGLRDLDAGERDMINRWNGAYPATMHDIDRYGLVATMANLDAWVRSSGATALWVSFDVDVLDPVLAPGTGTAVRGGLSYREAHLCAELMHEHMQAPDCPYRLVGLDLVETNPLFDTNNQTATTAAEWIASLLGKTIL